MQAYQCARKFQRKIRLSQLEKIKSRTRGLLLDDLAKKQSEKSFEYQPQSQQLILNHIKRSIQGQENLQSEQIFEYIDCYEHTFSHRFRNSFTELVIGQLYKHNYCLFALCKLIQKTEKIEILQTLDLQLFFQILYNDTEQISLQDLESRTLLLFNILLKAQNKGPFRIVQNYHQLFGKLGYFHTIYLSLMNELSYQKLIVPSRQSIRQYLELKIQEYNSQNQIAFIQITELIFAYLQTNFTVRLFEYFLEWTVYNFFEIQETEILREVIYSGLIDILKSPTKDIAQIAQIIFKHKKLLNLRIRKTQSGSLYELIALVLSKIKPSQRISFIEQNGLLLLTFCTQNLSIASNNDQVVNLFEILMYVFEADENYVLQAKSFNITYYLNYYSASTSLKIYKTAQLIKDTWDFN